MISSFETKEPTAAASHNGQGDAAQTERRARNEAARRLLRRWLADESGYDEATFPVVKALMEEHRLSDRRRFRDESDA